MPSHTLSPGAESPLGLFAETSSSLSLPSLSDDGKSIIYNQEDRRQPMDTVAGRKGDVKSSSSLSSSLAASPSARAMLTTTSHDDESTVRGKNNKKKKEKKKTGVKKREICKKVAEVTGISVEIVCCFVSLSMVLMISTVSLILTWPLKLGLQSFFWRYESFVERWDGTTPDDYFLAPLWEWCSRTGPFASFIGAATFPGVLGLIFYFISCLPMFILDLMERYGGFRGMEDYKIRGKGRPTSDLGDWRRVLGYTFTTMVLYIFPGLFFQFVTRGPWLYCECISRTWLLHGSCIFSLYSLLLFLFLSLCLSLSLTLSLFLSLSLYHTRYTIGILMQIYHPRWPFGFHPFFTPPWLNRLFITTLNPLHSLLQ